MNGAGMKTAGRILIHLLIVRPFLKLFCGVNLRGGQNLSGLKQFILIANHNSHLDVLLLSFLLPPGEIVRTTPIAHHGYFDQHRWLFRLVEFLFRPVWITRGQTALKDDPLAEARRRLKEGHSLIVFPEGTRGEPGVMEYFKSGIGRLVVDFPDVMADRTGSRSAHGYGSPAAVLELCRSGTAAEIDWNTPPDNPPSGEDPARAGRLRDRAPPPATQRPQESLRRGGCSRY